MNVTNVTVHMNHMNIVEILAYRVHTKTSNWRKNDKYNKIGKIATLFWAFCSWINSFVFIKTNCNTGTRQQLRKWI